MAADTALLDTLTKTFRLTPSERQAVAEQFAAAVKGGATALHALTEAPRTAQHRPLDGGRGVTFALQALAVAAVAEMDTPPTSEADQETAARRQVAEVVERLRAEGKTAHADSLAEVLATPPTP